MARLPAWRRWAWPTRVVAIVEFVLFVADGLLADAGLAGLMERLLAAVGALAIAAIALVILRNPARPAD